MYYLGPGDFVHAHAACDHLRCNLAKAGDVVVVTINHRLNVFDYTNLSHIDAELFGDAANAGQLDIIARAIHGNWAPGGFG